MTSYVWQPASSDVALLIGQRVLDSSGSGLADFNSNTTPTQAQVVSLAAMVANQVAAQVGIIPDGTNYGIIDLTPLAKNVTAKGTAWWVETSFYMDDMRGHADLLRTEYEAALADLAQAADAVRSSGAEGIGADQPLPVFGFPSPNFDPRVPVTSWTTNF